MQSPVPPAAGARPPWLVWVTRSRPGAAATAAAVRARGHLPTVSPLIETYALPAAPPDLADVSALAFTSAAGVRAYAALEPRRGLPVFAVGHATAEAAREAGFARVEHADGDGRDLASRLVAARPSRVVLAPGARVPAFDLAAALAAHGVVVRALPVYATRPASPPPPDLVADLLTGAVDAILLQSASAGRALAAVAAELEIASPPRLLALSPACLAGPQDWPAAVAAAPRERDLLALLPRLDTPVAPR